MFVRSEQQAELRAQGWGVSVVWECDLRQREATVAAAIRSALPGLPALASPHFTRTAPKTLAAADQPSEEVLSPGCRLTRFARSRDTGRGTVAGPGHGSQHREAETESRFFAAKAAAGTGDAQAEAMGSTKRRLWREGSGGEPRQTQPAGDVTEQTAQDQAHATPGGESGTRRSMRKRARMPEEEADEAATTATRRRGMRRTKEKPG